MKFPLLKNNQVAVLRADGGTGTILTPKGELYKNDSHQSPYVEFDNLVMAQEYVKNEAKLNDTFEFIIYDYNQNVLDFIKATHWNK